MLTGKYAILNTVTEELRKEEPDWQRICIALNAEAKYHGKELVLRHRSNKKESEG